MRRSDEVGFKVGSGDCVGSGVGEMRLGDLGRLLENADVSILR